MFEINISLNRPFQRRASIFLGAMYLTIACAEPALAQQSTLVPPVVTLTDKNGVDLIGGYPTFSLDAGKIGYQENGLSYRETWSSGGHLDNWQQWLYRYQDDNNLQIYGVINLGDRSVKFQRDSATGKYFVTASSYAELVESDDGKTFTFTEKDGTRRVFSVVPAISTGLTSLCSANAGTSPGACALFLKDVKKPNGEEIVSNWEISGQYARLLNIESSFGYRAVLDHYYNGTNVNANWSTWMYVTQIRFYNLTNPDLIKGIINRSFNNDSSDIITTTGGNVWQIRYSGPALGGAGEILGIKKPGATGYAQTFTYGTPHFDRSIVSASDNGIISKYDLNISGADGLMTTTDALGGVSRYKFSVFKSKVSTNSTLPSQIKDPLGRTTNYVQGPFYQISSYTNPEGDLHSYSYDSRANLTGISLKAKSNSTVPDIVQTASYPASCISPLTCNRPIDVTDANGNTTSFTYSTDHGGIVTKTDSVVNGIAPVKRYSYVQRSAWIAAPGGGWVKSFSPIWLPASEKMCRTGATVGDACANGAADEVVTSYDYGPDSGPNNLLLRGKVVTADGVSRRTCFGYDAIGNRISETKPRAGLTICP